MVSGRDEHHETKTSKHITQDAGGGVRNEAWAA